MKRLGRRISSSGIYAVKANANRDVIPSIVLTRPSEASIFQFTNDRDYFRMLDIKVQGRNSSRRKFRNSTKTSNTNISNKFSSPKLNRKQLAFRQRVSVVENDTNSAIFEADDEADYEDDKFDEDDEDDFEECHADDLDSDSDEEEFSDGDIETAYQWDRQNGGNDSDDEEQNDVNQKKFDQNHCGNREMLARSARFMSIMYAITLIIVGAMCTMMNIQSAKNPIRDWFIILISVVGFGYLLFLHWDILRYKQWMLTLVRPLVNGNGNNNQNVRQPSERFRLKDSDTISTIDNFTISTTSKATSTSKYGRKRGQGYGNRHGKVTEDYDNVSMSTAVIFDFFENTKPSSNLNSCSNAKGKIKNNKKNKNKKGEKLDKESKTEKCLERPETFTEFGYRFFLGKHSNDFYLKTGMIIFCFGNILHIGIEIVQLIYFYIHRDENCQDPSKLTMNTVRFLFSFYQLFMIFKYSNIIINRYPNVARFALMHLLGTSISIWLDTITDEAVDDYIMNKLGASIDYHDPNNVTNMVGGIQEDDDEYRRFLQIISSEQDSMFRNILIHMHNCSHLSIINYHTLSAIPYLYPFTIEYNIALASIWYMIWINIGNVCNKSLFYVDKSNSDSSDASDSNSEEWHNADSSSLHPSYRYNDSDRESVRRGQNRQKNYGLSLNIDCHASNRGLFFGLAILLVTIITIVIFFSTIKKDVYKHFGVMTYSLQIALLTVCCFVIIPIAFYKIRQLDVVKREHRDNPFTMMHDILILIPIPFYIVHYSISIIANIGDDNQEYRDNNHILVAIDLMTIVQVVLQSPFIVDGLRRCSNQASVRYRKPGRELITLCLILNVTLWILNTFELKSVEVYHATHYYFGEFFGMLISHTTLPFMLFYRFHSSVCLSNIWKYAYERDEM